MVFVKKIFLSVLCLILNNIIRTAPGPDHEVHL